MMQRKTQRSVASRGGGKKPAADVVGGPEGSPGYLVMGLLLGVVFGVLIGTALTALVGERSMLFAQHLWNRLWGVDTDSEQVHFEWLLQ
jgi:hypothetical protein